eukprot:INCI13575.1.p1 GENE.INCI13575.1~~INCI13575.1.p1  ORF type:complete len:524 (+),score=80.22 INCI13575.1:137-1708(+)
MSTAEAAELTPRPSTGSPGSGSSSASASPPKSTVRRLEAIVVKIVEGHRQDGATSHKVLRHFAVTDDLRTKVLKILSSNSSRRFHKKKVLVREKIFNIETKAEEVAYIAKQFFPQARTPAEVCYLCGGKRRFGDFALVGGSYNTRVRQAFRLTRCLPQILCELCFRRHFTPNHCSRSIGGFLSGFAVLPSCFDARPFHPFPTTSPLINKNLKRLVSSARRASQRLKVGMMPASFGKSAKVTDSLRGRAASSDFDTDTQSDAGNATANISEVDFVKTFRRRAENDLLEQFASPKGRAFLAAESEKRGKSISEVTNAMVAQVHKAAGRRAKKLFRQRRLVSDGGSSTDGGGSGRGRGTRNGRELRDSKQDKSGGGSSTSPSSQSPAGSPNSKVFKTLKLDFSGHLHMRKGISALFKKGWGWRMIRLRGFKLLCYDVDFRSGANKLKSTIDLTHCSVMHSPEDRATGRPHTFRILDAKGKYVAVFAASTAMDEQEWIDRINQSIVFANSQDTFKKSPVHRARLESR